ncbi:hypothetical protein LQW54_007113 [Pestalotiopsis sp. IQ-011]
MHLPQLVPLLATAHFAAGQSTTVVSLYLGEPLEGVATAATGYVAAADATATTYVLDCLKAFCIGSERAEYARVTAGPGWQEYSRRDDDGEDGFEEEHTSCTFLGTTTGAVCEDESTSSSGTQFEAYYATETYVPNPPERTGQENIFSWPGLQAVLITSGVELLAEAATATETSSSSTQTAPGTTTDTATGTESSEATATGTAKSGAGSSRGHQLLGYGAICLAVLVISV